jgi:hypothetical protein
MDNIYEKVLSLTSYKTLYKNIKITVEFGQPRMETFEEINGGLRQGCLLHSFFLICTLTKPVRNETKQFLTILQ